MMVKIIIAHRVNKVLGIGIMPHEVDQIPEEWLEYIDAFAGLLKNG